MTPKFGITNSGNHAKEMVHSLLSGSVTEHIHPYFPHFGKVDILWETIPIEIKWRTRNQVRPYKGCVEIFVKEKELYVIPPNFILEYAIKNLNGQHACQSFVCCHGPDGGSINKFISCRENIQKDIKNAWEMSCSDQMYQRVLNECKKEIIRQLEMVTILQNIYRELKSSDPIEICPVELPDSNSFAGCLQ